MRFQLMCPSCKGKRMYNPRGSPMGKSVKCFYCNRSFTAHSGGTNTNIVKRFE